MRREFEPHPQGIHPDLRGRFKIARVLTVIMKISLAVLAVFVLVVIAAAGAIVLVRVRSGVDIKDALLPSVGLLMFALFALSFALIPAVMAWVSRSASQWMRESTWVLDNVPSVKCRLRVEERISGDSAGEFWAYLYDLDHGGAPMRGYKIDVIKYSPLDRDGEDVDAHLSPDSDGPVVLATSRGLIWPLCPPFWNWRGRKRRHAAM